MDRRLREGTQISARILQDADALLIVAGAGMGIDSGLPDYRGPNGLWNTWHPSQALNMRYEDLSTHELFMTSPEIAWGFQTYLTSMYHGLDPHEGYHILLAMAQKKFRDNYFVITSNVDSQFLKTGFSEQKLYEVHGTKRLWQCLDSSCNKNHFPWNMDVTDLPAIDAETLYASPPFPKCKHCPSTARPNVSFFGDLFFNEKCTKVQSGRLLEWLESNKGKKLAIVELGCGISEHSIRFCLKNDQYTMMSNEWKLPKAFLSNDNTHLIRINPDDQTEPGVVHVNAGAMRAIKMINRHFHS
jgi:NAD-dependent SIR2 family protein deacetylase